MEKINNFEILSEKNIVSKRLNDESNSPYFLADKTCDFLYWHDDYYAESIFSEELINKFTSKYNNRYDRLFNALNSNKKILILTVQHYDNIYANVNRSDLLITAYKKLQSLNPNLYMLGINYCEWNFNCENLVHKYIEFNKNLNFSDSKNDFQNKLYSYVNDVLK